MTETKVPSEGGEDAPAVEEVALLSRERVSDLELFAAIALIALIALVF
jgi:hypothetical protein